MSEKISSNIQVKVIARYVPDMCIGQQFFKYIITIHNASRDTVMLMSRHWEIQNFLDEVRVVDGLGVVGEQPVLKSGESYTYSSGVAINTSLGLMNGYFTFLNLNTRQEFDVEIPNFELIADYLLS